MSEINTQIHRCISFIKENLTSVDSIVDKLIEKDVIAMAERDSIIAQRTQREQIQCIIELLTKKQKGDAFIAALYETNNDHVAEKITSVETEGKDIEKSKTFTIDNTNSSEKITKITNELNNVLEENNHLKTIQQSLRDSINEKTLKLQEITMKYFNEQARCKELNNENENLKKEILEGQKRLQIDIQKYELKLNEKDTKIRTLNESLNCVMEELQRHKESQKKTTDKLLEINIQLQHENDQRKKENEDIKLLWKTMSDNVSTIMARLSPTRSRKPIQPWRTGTKLKPAQTPRKK